MHQLLFGTAGIPISTNPRNTIEGIKQVKKLNLDSMELEFVHSINLNEKTAIEVNKTAKENNVILTTHGQYAVNLNATDKAKLEASKKRIIEACKIASLSGSWSICYHMAYYMKDDKTKVTEKVKEAVKEIIKKLKDENIKIWLRPETGGRITQWGELNELIDLSLAYEQVLPCVDFAHHYSRSLGKVNTYGDFRNILEELEKHLGRACLDNMHIHTEGIAFNKNGEKNHLNLNECNFNYKDLVKIWKEFKIKGVVTCESPNIEEDALLLKKTYEKL